MATVAERRAVASEPARRPSVAGGGGARPGAGSWSCCLHVARGSSGSCAFYVYPMLASLYFSFTHYDLLSEPRWVGLANYRFMFTSDPLFWLAMRNTAVDHPGRRSRSRCVFAIGRRWC